MLYEVYQIWVDHMLTMKKCQSHSTYLPTSQQLTTVCGLLSKRGEYAQAFCLADLMPNMPVQQVAEHASIVFEAARAAKCRLDTSVLRIIMARCVLADTPALQRCCSQVHIGSFTPTHVLQLRLLTSGQQCRQHGNLAERGQSTITCMWLLAEPTVMHVCQVLEYYFLNLIMGSTVGPRVQRYARFPLRTSFCLQAFEQLAVHTSGVVSAQDVMVMVEYHLRTRNHVSALQMLQRHSSSANTAVPPHKQDKLFYIALESRRVHPCSPQLLLELLTMSLQQKTSYAKSQASNLITHCLQGGNMQLASEVSVCHLAVLLAAPLIIPTHRQAMI